MLQYQFMFNKRYLKTILIEITSKLIILLKVVFMPVAAHSCVCTSVYRDELWLQY